MARKRKVKRSFRVGCGDTVSVAVRARAMPKRCRFYRVRCWRSSCSVFDRATGMVYCCLCHPNPFGFHHFREVKRNRKKRVRR